MKQTTKINLLVFIFIIFILVLGLFALARFFGKQLIQPCMQEGFTDSEIDRWLLILRDTGTREMEAKRARESKWCDSLVPLYTKPGLISRIVLKGNDWLHLRNIQIINGDNILYKYNTDYTMDITGSPKFLSNDAAYDFSKMGNKFDSMFHSGTAKNVVFTITLKTPSVIKAIAIMNRFNCCWERINNFTMYGYNAAGTKLFSKKLDDPALSNFKEGTPSNYNNGYNMQKNTAAYIISPFGYVSLFLDNVCGNKLPIMDVKIADYKRIYLTQNNNYTFMMSESGEIAVYSGSISNFTEDRWKNARKIPIPVGYSIQTTIFPNAVLPALRPATTTAATTRPATTRPATTTSATTGSKLDSEIDNLKTNLKDPATKKFAIEMGRKLKLCDILIPFYTKPGLISRIVLKGNDWLHLRNIQIINGDNILYKYNTDYTMDITGSPKFLSNDAAYDFSKMGNKFDSMFHSGTAKNVVFTITLKTPSVIKAIAIMNRFNCCWERINNFTMYGYNAAGTELFSKKLNDPALSNFKEGTPSNYNGNIQKNMAVYGISPFGYFSLSVDDVCLIKVPIMDVKIADYKRIYLIEFTSNSTMMMSESGEIAVYPGSISNFTEDRWKNARKIPIPVGYSIQTTIFPNATLPSVPTTAPPTTTPVRTSAAATTPAPTTTRPPVPTTTTPVPTIAATTLAPSTITPAPTIAATTPAITTKTVATTTPSAMVPSSTSVTYANIDNKTTSSASYSTAYKTVTFNL